MWRSSRPQPTAAKRGNLSLSGLQGPEFAIGFSRAPDTHLGQDYRRLAVPGGLRPLLPDYLWQAGPAIVVAEGFEVNGHKITAQVDTLYTGSLLIHNDSIRGLGLEAASSRSSEMRDFPCTDGGVKMKKAHAPKEKFAGTELGGIQPTVYFPTPGVHEPDGLFDATIGLELMRDSVVNLDFRNLTISIRRQGGDGPGCFPETVHGARQNAARSTPKSPPWGRAEARWTRSSVPALTFLLEYAVPVSSMCTREI